MKITRQIIAAAGFASLLFAPLAQAQDTDTGQVNLRVLSLSSQIGFTAAGDMNFGNIIPPNTAAPVELTCASNGVATAVISGTAVSGAACAVITVRAGTDGGSYKLQVSPPILTGLDSSSTPITPEFIVFDDTGTAAIAGLNPINGGDVGIATNEDTLAANGTKTYILGGSATIQANQVHTRYSGTYTVETVVQ